MKSFLQLYTGEGKGKSTALVGMMVRAIGCNKKIALFQFLKGRKSGEISFFEKNCPEIFIKRINSGEKFLWEMNLKEKEEIQIEMEKTVFQIIDLLKKQSYDMIFLDEFLDVVSSEFISKDLAEKLVDLKGKTEIVMSGRKAWESLEKKAGLHSEVEKKKHYFDQKIGAREGIEY